MTRKHPAARTHQSGASFPWGLAILFFVTVGIAAGAFVVRSWVSSDIAAPSGGNSIAGTKTQSQKWTPFTIDMQKNPPPAPPAENVSKPPPPVAAPITPQAAAPTDETPDVYAACDELPDEQVDACQEAIDEKLSALEDACDKYEEDAWQECMDAADRLEEYKPKK
jgi:hypothetical protein